MASDGNTVIRRIPTLVQLCQRVASAHVNSIASFGDGIDGLRYGLIKPILENCSVETLVRLQKTSPYIQKDTPEIWKDRCFRTYPLMAERYLLQEIEEPESWQDQYFIFHEAEAKRFQEAGSRARNRRVEAGEKKKEREVKLTDRMPPTKRSRGGWSANTQPKTLFQKTRSEASKIQRNMYTSRMIPPMPTGKQYRVLPGAPSAKPPAPPSATSDRRVTVHTVTYRRPSALSSTVASSSSTSTSSRSSVNPSAAADLMLAKDSATKSSPSVASSKPSEPRLSKANTPTKKDPMSAMFMPSHHRHSQLPRQTLHAREVPSR